MGQTESNVDVRKAKTIPCKEHRNVRASVGNVVDDMDLLRHFLYLGTETINSPSHVDRGQKYADLIYRLIKDGRGKEVVQLIATISYCGSAPRQDYLIFALAVCARSDDIITKKLAYDNMCQICRIPTHLFMFVSYCQLESAKSQPPSKGWGRAHRRAVLKWYEEKCKNPEGIARLLMKYKSRKIAPIKGKVNRWSHKNIFRLVHPSSDDDLMEVVKEFVLFGFKKAQTLTPKKTENIQRVTQFLTYIEKTIEAKKCTDEEEMVDLIQRHGLQKEHVPTALKSSHRVWEAIIKKMTSKAKIRSICKLSAKGFCGEDSETEKEIIETITDADDLHRLRVHPYMVLSALLIYVIGEKRNRRRITKWKVNEKIVKALNEAYELSFPSVQPTGKRFLLAADVSESMRVASKCFPGIMCYQAAASLMMVTARTERNCKVFVFSEDLTQIRMEKEDTFSQTVAKLDSLQSGKNSDSALPMRWAEANKRKIDVFIVYTNNISTDEITHRSKALAKYRATMNKPEAKLIVVEMPSAHYTSADPTKCVVTGSEEVTTRDYREINIIGFDAHAPIQIAKFSKDEI